jgi:hypothetical protein
MMEAPSGNGGSGFCTVKSRPLHVDAEVRVVEFRRDLAKRCVFRGTGICEHDIEPPLLPLDLREQTIEIAKFRDVSVDAGHVSTDFFHYRREFAVTATGDENVRAFACEPLCCRQPDAAIATGDERGLAFAALAIV